jgi:hypothetical protein
MPIHQKLFKKFKKTQINAPWFGRFQHDQQNKQTTFLIIGRLYVIICMYILLMYFMPLVQVWIGYPIVFNFQWEKPFKIQYFPNFRSKISKITWVKSYTLKGVPMILKTCLNTFAYKFYFWFRWNFQWKNLLLFNIQSIFSS